MNPMDIFANCTTAEQKKLFDLLETKPKAWLVDNINENGFFVRIKFKNPHGKTKKEINSKLKTRKDILDAFGFTSVKNSKHIYNIHFPLEAVALTKEAYEQFYGMPPEDILPKLKKLKTFEEEKGSVEFPDGYLLKILKEFVIMITIFGKSTGGLIKEGKIKTGVYNTPYMIMTLNYPLPKDHKFLVINLNKDQYVVIHFTNKLRYQLGGLI